MGCGRERPDRLIDKDAGDVLRLIRSTPVAVMAYQLRVAHPHAESIENAKQRSTVRSTLPAVIEVGSRKRNQPAPPHAVFEALTQPDRQPSRPWLELLDDERRPRVIRADAPSTVVWSSLWIKRPDALVRFDLPPDASNGTALRWTLLVEEPIPDDALVGHMRKRLNQLINANLRFTFGQ